MHGLQGDPCSLQRMGVLFDNIDEYFWFMPLMSTCADSVLAKSIAEQRTAEAWEVLSLGPLKSAETTRLLSCSIDFVRLRQGRCSVSDN